MPKYKYHDYVVTLAKRFESLFLSINAEYGFDYGDEFEFVICEALASSLPSSYGIARGFAVDERGTVAGDDIVIYEKSRFPTLAVRGSTNFARKEFVPIESIYTYIEAKHTIHLKGTDDQSLQKACSQVGKVKALCESREEKDPKQISAYQSLNLGFSANFPDHFPQKANPSHGVVFARNVREKRGGEFLEPAAIETQLQGTQLDINHAPDLIVLGDSVVLVPYLTIEGKKCVRSPFFIPGKSQYHIVQVDGVAFGVGLLWLQFALDWIDLGVMPWHRIIVDALGIPLE